MLCELAKIDSNRFDTLFVVEDTVFVHGVTPLLISREYLMPLVSSLRFFNLYHERHMNEGMPAGTFFEEDEEE